MGTGDKMLGGNLEWTSIPSRGNSNTPSQLHATETGISSSSVGLFGPSAALTLPYMTAHFSPLLVFYDFSVCLWYHGYTSYIN